MGALNLLITGAGGTLGRATLEAALARGHRVRALVRRPGALAGAETIICDLAQPGPTLAEALAGIDVVLHLAASLTGDEATHQRDTLDATRNLYAALPAGIPVVLASSMAVYEGRSGHIDEASPLEGNPAGRDAYMRAKLAQEQIARAHSDTPTTILRIGALTGPGHEWNAHIGLRFGPVALRLGGRGALPTVRLEDAAEALVLAAEAAPKAQIFNIIGDNLPNCRTYLAQIAQKPRLTLPLPWQSLLPLAELVSALKLPVPGLLRPATLRYRFAARSYANGRAKRALGWQPGPWEGQA